MAVNYVLGLYYTALLVIVLLVMSSLFNPLVGQEIAAYAREITQLLQHDVDPVELAAIIAEGSLAIAGKYASFWLDLTQILSAVLLFGLKVLLKGYDVVVGYSNPIEAFVALQNFLSQSGSYLSLVIDAFIARIGNTIAVGRAFDVYNTIYGW